VLARVPTSVSVSPDGVFAVVGHPDAVSYVDLVNATMIDEYPIGTEVGDVVLSENGYAYAFLLTDQWSRIYIIELDTGLVTRNDYSVTNGTSAKLHPDGNSLYAANNNISPSGMAKIGSGLYQPG